MTDSTYIDQTTESNQQPVENTAAYNEVYPEVGTTAWQAAGVAAFDWAKTSDTLTLQGVLPEVTLVGLNNEAAPETGKTVKQDDGSEATYDDQGRVVKIKNSRGNETSFKYEGDQNVVTEVTETIDGKTTTYKKDKSSGHYIDDQGKDTGNTSFSVDKNGNYSWTESNGWRATQKADGSRIEVDQDGNLRSVETAYGSETGMNTKIRYGYTNGELTSFSVEGRGLHTGVEQEVDGYTLYTRDAKGNWSANGIDAGISNVSTKPDGTMTFTNPGGDTVVEDSAGRVRSLTDKQGNQTTFEYQDQRISKMTVTEDGVTHSYTLRGHKYYDENGNDAKIQFIDQEPGGGYSIVYSDQSRFVHTSTGSDLKYGPTGDLDKITYPDGSSREMKYDWRNTCDEVIETDPNGNKHTYKRDIWHNKWTDENGNDAPFTDFRSDKHATGKVEYKSKDGAWITENSVGEISAIDWPDGSSVHFRTVNGQIQTVDFMDKDHNRESTLVVNDNGTLSDRFGNYVGYDLVVSPDGTVSYTQKGGAKVTYLPNGEATVQAPLNPPNQKSWINFP